MLLYCRLGSISVTIWLPKAASKWIASHLVPPFLIGLTRKKPVPLSLSLYRSWPALNLPIFLKLSPCHHHILILLHHPTQYYLIALQTLITIYLYQAPSLALHMSGLLSLSGGSPTSNLTSPDHLASPALNTWSDIELSLKIHFFHPLHPFVHPIFIISALVQAVIVCNPTCRSLVTLFFFSRQWPPFTLTCVCILASCILTFMIESRYKSWFEWTLLE